MRIALMIIRLFLAVPVYFIGIWRHGKVKEVNHEKAFAYVKKVTKRANHAGRVKIESYGLENIPEDNGFIMFPNHQGLFDVLVFLESCPNPFAFIIKKEASNLILLKQVTAALGSLSIDREDVRQSMAVINRMAEEVRGGKNFLIFAEGTRSRNGNQLLDFKGGSFKSAVKAKCPIVPCVLIDSFRPFDENSIKQVTVKVIYLPPLYYEDYKNMKTVEIAAKVRIRIETAIAEHTSKEF